MAQFDISAAGHLVFLPGSDQGLGFAPVALALADRAGSMTRVDVPPGPFVHVRASPEGTHLALDSDDGDEAVVWIYALGGANALRRLTVGGRNQFPVWSPDGQHVVFQSDREGDQAIFVQRADGVGGTERLTTPDDGEEHVPESWSPDGPGGGGRMVHKAIPPTAERPDEVRQKHETLAAGPVRHHVEPGVELRFFRQGADGARNRRDHDGEQAQASKAAMEAIGLNKTYWALTIEPSV